MMRDEGAERKGFLVRGKMCVGGMAVFLCVGEILISTGRYLYMYFNV